MPYAKGTQVSVYNSRSEAERILKNAGATKMGFLYDDGLAIIGFELNGIAVKLSIKTPNVDEVMACAEIAQKKPYGWKGSNASQRRAWATTFQETELRRKWRVLILLLKAKLEAIAEGETTVEREFLHDVVIRGGRTVGELMRDDLQQIISGKVRPKLLLGMGGDDV